MGMKRVRKTDGAHLPLGNAQGAAVVAALVAILLAPVVCRGLLRGTILIRLGRGTGRPARLW